MFRAGEKIKKRENRKKSNAVIKWSSRDRRRIADFPVRLAPNRKTLLSISLDRLRIRGNMMAVLLCKFHLKYCFINSIFNQNRVQKIRIIYDMAK